MSQGAKLFETLAARAALAGVVLNATRTDLGQLAYIVTQWALTRELESLEAVAAWLDTARADKPALAGAGGGE